jgi:hypothetical protein
VGGSGDVREGAICRMLEESMNEVESEKSGMRREAYR